MKSVAAVTVTSEPRPGLTEEQRAMRKLRVGASEVAALFGEHPYCTYWELWMRKAGRMPERPDDRDPSDSAFWGQVLEPAVARGVELKLGWSLVPGRNVMHPVINRFGSLLDFEILPKDVNPYPGPGVLEVKTVDRIEYAHWPGGEPPKHYLLQLQAQLACTGYGWGAIAVLIGGNKLRVFTYERHEATIERILLEVMEFWRSVDADEEPDIDFEADCDAILALYSRVAPGKVLRLDDPDVAALVDDYLDAANSTSRDEKRRKRLKAELLTVMEDAEELHCRGRKVTARLVPASQRSYTVPEHRGFHVSKPKQKGKNTKGGQDT